MLGVRSVRSVGILSVKGDPFVACDVCAFPVWRPCYEYERKDRNQSCPQCKTRYKRLKGSPAIPGDREEDIDGDDETTNFPFSSQTQNEKQKTAERMLNWHMTYGRGMIIVLQIMIKRFLITIYLFSPVDMRFLGSCLLLPLNIFRSPLLDLRI